MNLKNSVRLIGNLGMDPEVKTLNNEKKVAKFSIATSESYLNEERKKVMETQWHSIVGWGKVADFMEKH